MRGSTLNLCKRVDVRCSKGLKNMLLILSTVGAAALVIDWRFRREIVDREIRTHMHNGTWYPEIRHAKKNSTVALATSYNDAYYYIPFTDRWVAYAKKHRYDWYGINTGQAEIEFPTLHWHKPALIYDLLSFGYEFLIYSDGDTVLLHPERTIEDFVQMAPPPTQLWISRDLSWAATKINAGLLIVRRGMWSLEMLKNAIRESADPRITPQDWPREQGSIDRWIKLSPQKFYKIFPYGETFQVFSSFGDEPEKELDDAYQQNIWVLHFPGGYSDSRHEYAQAVFNFSQMKYPV